MEIRLQKTIDKNKSIDRVLFFIFLYYDCNNQKKFCDCKKKETHYSSFELQRFIFERT